MTTTKEIIAKLESRIAEDCSTVDRETAFDEMIDECYSFESVGGPFEYMTPSRVLKEVDPTAYRCGVNDYADSLELIEIGDDYYRQEDAEEIKTEMISNLESEIEDLETEIDELNDAEDEDRDDERLEEAQNELRDKQADLNELNNHSF